MSESPWEIGSRGLEQGHILAQPWKVNFVDCENPRRVSIHAKSEKAGDGLAGK
jgi:hypothetical protein